MKTSNNSFRPDKKYSRKTISKAKHYAAAAILSLTLLKHYSAQARSLNLPSARQAAFQDYLKNKREFYILNAEL